MQKACTNHAHDHAAQTGLTRRTVGSVSDGLTWSRPPKGQRRCSPSGSPSPICRRYAHPAQGRGRANPTGLRAVCDDRHDMHGSRLFPWCPGFKRLLDYALQIHDQLGVSRTVTKYLGRLACQLGLYVGEVCADLWNVWRHIARAP